MKLGSKLLLATALTALVALGSGAVNTTLMQREAASNAERFAAQFASLQAITGAQEQLGRLHAGVYRTVALIASLDDAAVKASGEAMRQQIAGIKRTVAGVAESAGAGGSELPAEVAAMSALLDRYAQQVHSALDLASVDPNTGVAAMQNADESFKGASHAMAGIVGRVDQAGRELLQVSAAKASRNTLLLTGLSLLVTAAALAFSVRMLRGVVRSLKHAAEVTRAVAAGDLSVQPRIDRDDELGELQRGLGQMVERLHGSLLTVRRVADSIATAGTQIASGNHDLSERTEQAASNLQQTASSMEELTGTVRQSADAATQADSLARSASAVAQRGGDAVSQVVATMDEINGASRKIADIIGVIDGIAFQTNILALNAAVEAARAGEQGRGFAVVAGEVRSLAGRSAEAAREIKTLISASVERVDNGTRQVREAGQTMAEIVASVQRVSTTIGEISAAASQQSLGLDQVHGAVGELDRMTQQNAALVEQSAAASSHLKTQASELASLVAEFRLLDSGAHAAPA